MVSTWTSKFNCECEFLHSYSFTLEGCNLLKNTLYELYSCHPTIDFVGYLEGASANYLIFIQLSLSKYADHRAKLGDVLSNSPKKDHLSEGEPSNLSLLQFYSGRALDHYERNDNPNVVLLYISPRGSRLDTNFTRSTETDFFTILRLI